MERNPSTDSDVVQIEAKFVTGSNPKPSDPVIVRVPWSWRRTVENSSVIYTTPSGVCLSNFEDVKNYLLLDGTCKCGLECPLDYKSYFSFDPKAQSVAAPVSTGTPPVPNPARYCSRRSKTHEMAAHEERTGTKIQHLRQPLTTGRGRLKRKKKPYANLVMTQQMLAAREAEKKRINEIIEEERRQHEARMAAAAAAAPAHSDGSNQQQSAKNKATPGTAVKNSKYRRAKQFGRYRYHYQYRRIDRHGAQ